MKYLFIILTTLLIGASQIGSKRIKKEMREYDVKVRSDGSEIKELKRTTQFSATGQIDSEIEACTDSICCHYNKSFRLHKNKNEYWYNDSRLILRVFRTCNTLPSYKDFHEYKFDGKKRLIETRELTYNFETDNEKYENGKWVSVKIGDSTLTETNIHLYTYTEFDSVKEEKIIIRSKYSSKPEKSWTVKFNYDTNNRLIEKEHTPYGVLKLKAQWFYDKKGRVSKMESNLTGEDVKIEWSYDENNRVLSQKDGVMTTNFEYDSKGNLILSSTIGNKYKDSQTRHYYNEFGDVLREEVSYNHEPAFVKVYEYIYYD